MDCNNLCFHSEQHCEYCKKNYDVSSELYKAMPYLFDDLKLSSFFSGIGAFEVAFDRLYESIDTGNFT